MAVARGAEKLAAAQQAGALHLIDSAETDDLRRAVLETGPTHVVYDAVGGVLGAEAARTLEPEGRHLLIGFASGDVPALEAEPHAGQEHHRDRFQLQRLYGLQ